MFRKGAAEKLPKDVLLPGFKRNGTVPDLKIIGSGTPYGEFSADCYGSAANPLSL